RDKEPATPEPGAGMFRAERCPGQRNISGFLATTPRRASHLTSYSWKQFIRKIDQPLNRISTEQFAKRAALTWNFESLLRTDLLNMCRGCADRSSASLATWTVISEPR